MNTGAAIAAVLAVAAITYGSRAGLVLFLADRPLPEWMERALRNVGPAVFSALVITFVAGGEGPGGVAIEEVAALGAGVGAAALSRNLIAALVAGMGTLWIVAMLV